VVVERDGAWDSNWGDECARVLGGERAFAFGFDPTPVPDDWNPNVYPQRSLKGVISGPYSTSTPGEMESKLSIFSVNRTAVGIIPQGVPKKYLALWLPENVQGYIKFSGWPGAGEKVVRSEEAIARVRAGKKK
jgi:hypothetical protein